MSTIKELWHGNICPQESGVFDAPILKELQDTPQGIAPSLKGS